MTYVFNRDFFDNYLDIFSNKRFPNTTFEIINWSAYDKYSRSLNEHYLNRNCC